MNEASVRDARPILLRGRSVGLALMIREDIATIARWHQDLAFTANMGEPGDAQTIEKRQKAFEQNASMRRDSVEFAVLRLVEGDLIGFGGLFDISHAATASLFVGIGEAALQNKGYGSEAVRLICEYGFFFRSLHAIKVEVNGFNRRAVHAYTRLGFRPVGRLRGTILLNGERYDQVIMDVLRDEFPLEHVASFSGLAPSPGVDG